MPTGAFQIRDRELTDNAFIAAFNRKFRGECLNAHWFMSLDVARRKTEDWRRYYNKERSYSGIGQMTPILLHKPVAHPARYRRNRPKTLASDDQKFRSGAKGLKLWRRMTQGLGSEQIALSQVRVRYAR